MDANERERIEQEGAEKRGEESKHQVPRHKRAAIKHQRSSKFQVPKNTNQKPANGHELTRIKNQQRKQTADPDENEDENDDEDDWVSPRTDRRILSPRDEPN